VDDDGIALADSARIAWKRPRACLQGQYSGAREPPSYHNFLRLIRVVLPALAGGGLTRVVGGASPGLLGRHGGRDSLELADALLHTPPIATRLLCRAPDLRVFQVLDDCDNLVQSFRKRWQLLCELPEHLYRWDACATS
jgi:hypothetical protein